MLIINHVKTIIYIKQAYNEGGPNRGHHQICMINLGGVEAPTGVTGQAAKSSNHHADNVQYHIPQNNANMLICVPLPCSSFEIMFHFEILPTNPRSQSRAISP